MPEPIWNSFLTEQDRAVFEKKGMAPRVGFGTRPALLVIDVNYSFCGDKPEPLLESIKRWNYSCGEDSWNAVGAMKPLIEKARAKGVPVIYTAGTRRPDNWDSGSWGWKNTRAHEGVTLSRNVDGSQIIPDIAPGPNDVVVHKQKPSGFSNSIMASCLAAFHVDSVIVVGGSTSGCVRATAVDAFNYNYKVIIPEECCFDRSEASHAICLFDLDRRYADVVKTSEIIDHLDTFPDGVFQPPASDPKKLDGARR
jgi:nicotinamidase-related amidase